MDNNKTMNDLSLEEKLFKFRNQALCIKSNIQILKDMWQLQSYFKEKNIGAFYKIVQDNCIFRIILETYKMLYDTTTDSMNFNGMANYVYKEMIKMKEFEDNFQELNDMKKNLKSNLNNYKNIKNIIMENRNKVYAHNDQEYHWFDATYIKNWGMTDQSYNDIMEISNICINYCNEILKLFNQQSVYEYRNHDDVKRLFGIKTEHDEEIELLEQLL